MEKTKAKRAGKMVKAIRLEAGKIYTSDHGIDFKIHQYGNDCFSNSKGDHMGGLWRQDGKPYYEFGSTAKTYGSLIREVQPKARREAKQ